MFYIHSIGNPVQIKKNWQRGKDQINRKSGLISECTELSEREKESWRVIAHPKIFFRPCACVQAPTPQRQRENTPVPATPHNRGKSIILPRYYFTPVTISMLLSYSNLGDNNIIAIRRVFATKNSPKIFCGRAFTQTPSRLGRETPLPFSTSSSTPLVSEYPAFWHLDTLPRYSLFFILIYHTKR